MIDLADPREGAIVGALLNADRRLILTTLHRGAIPKQDLLAELRREGCWTLSRLNHRVETMRECVASRRSATAEYSLTPDCRRIMDLIFRPEGPGGLGPDRGPRSTGPARGLAEDEAKRKDIVEIIITRHSAAAEWLAAEGVVSASAEVRAHLDVAEIRALPPGCTVVGTLPVHLAAEVCERGALYGHLAMTVPAEMRGQELSIAQMEECHPRVTFFDVAIAGTLSP